MYSTVPFQKEERWKEGFPWKVYQKQLAHRSLQDFGKKIGHKLPLAKWHFVTNDSQETRNLDLKSNLGAPGWLSRLSIGLGLRL